MQSTYKNFTWQTIKILSGLVFCHLVFSSFAYAQTSTLNTSAEPMHVVMQRHQLSGLFIEEAGVRLAFLGTNHTFDPDHAQIGGIETAFKRFKPSLVLTEGGLWPVADTQQQTIRQYGEMGLVTFMAKKAGIAIRSADAPTKDEIKYALNEHEASLVKLYYALRLVPQWAKQETGLGMDENMNKLLKNGIDGELVEVAPRNISELEQICLRHIPELLDWRSVQHNLSFDGGKVSILNEVDRTVNQFRNDYMEKMILEGIQANQDVFIIAGVTHLAKIMPGLTKKLSAKR